MTTMTVSQARAELPRILDLVERGERVEITRHGRTVAVIAPPPAANPRTAAVFEAARELRRQLEDARNQPLPAQGSVSVERAEELVRQIRADRDAD